MSKKQSRVSAPDAVREMYDATAESYSTMMDSEINHPMYAEILERLRSRLVDVPGTLVDAPCGSGHMLAMYHERFDASRGLFGADLSPRMVEVTQHRLGEAVETAVCDFRQMDMLAAQSAAAVISHFGLHHVDLNGVAEACSEWYRVLVPGGQLAIGAWDGSDAMDYGEGSDMVATMHEADELQKTLADAGFETLACNIEFDDDMQMNAVYIEALKPGRETGVEPK